MSGLFGEDRIAAELVAAGLDARTIDGWVYVALPDGRCLEITAEWGSSLLGRVYETPPDWFTDAARAASLQDVKHASESASGVETDGGG